MAKKRDIRCRHNEAKYKILSLLYHSKRYLAPRTIAESTGLSEGGVRTRLSKLTKYGYIWRKKCYFKGESGYLYRFLKPLGVRVYLELNRRVEIQEVTGMKVSLNWKEKVPVDVLLEFQRRVMR